MKPLMTVEVLDRLIGFPTVSRDSNLALIHWVQNYLNDWGVQSHLVPNANGSALGDVEPSIAVPFATEAGQLQRAGWSAVVCGPGSISQAHRPDEFVAAADLQKCERFLQQAVGKHCVT